MTKDELVSLEPLIRRCIANKEQALTADVLSILRAGQNATKDPELKSLIDDAIKRVIDDPYDEYFEVTAAKKDGKA
jgi:hypothetical protein